MTKTDSKPLLTINNCHSENCGEPPSIPDDNAWISYFENRHREQWVFWIDGKNRNAMLTSGEFDWTVRNLSTETVLGDPDEHELSGSFAQAIDALKEQNEKLTGTSDPTYAQLLECKAIQRIQPFSEDEWAWLQACWNASEWARSPSDA